MVITPTECTIYSNISASVGTIISKNLIPIVQERITMMLNNYFLTDLDITDTMTFDPIAGTITASGNSFVDKNFMEADDIYVFNSYRNDGYYTVDTVSDKVLTLISGSDIKDELSGRTILISIVKWPLTVKSVAARMCAYDYDVRDKVSANIKSKSLGPLSESFTEGEKDTYGYPKKLTSLLLDTYYIARVY